MSQHSRVSFVFLILQQHLIKHTSLVNSTIFSVFTSSTKLNHLYRTSYSVTLEASTFSSLMSAREGELFVSLEPTIDELGRNGGRYEYQQMVVSILIQEFGTEVRVICQTPPLARFQLNNSNIPFPRIPLGGQHTPAKPGEIRLLGQCLHLGYISDFFIIRGVPEYSIARREYRHQWQRNSIAVDDFIVQITEK